MYIQVVAIIALGNHTMLQKLVYTRLMLILNVKSQGDY